MNSLSVFGCLSGRKKTGVLRLFREKPKSSSRCRSPRLLVITIESGGQRILRWCLMAEFPSFSRITAIRGGTIFRAMIPAGSVILSLSFRPRLLYRFHFPERTQHTSYFPFSTSDQALYQPMFSFRFGSGQSSDLRKATHDRRML